MPAPTKAPRPAAPAIDRRLAARMSHLGNSTRLKILHLLAAGPLNVGELVEAIGRPATQPGVSHHLATMRLSGLVHSVAVGKTRVYRLDDAAAADLLRSLAAVLRLD